LWLSIGVILGTIPADIARWIGVCKEYLG